MHEMVAIISALVEDYGNASVYLTGKSESEVDLLIAELVWEYDYVVTKTDHSLTVSKKEF